MKVECVVKYDMHIFDVFNEILNFWQNSILCFSELCYLSAL